MHISDPELILHIPVSVSLWHEQLALPSISYLDFCLVYFELLLGPRWFDLLGMDGVEPIRELVWWLVILTVYIKEESEF